MLEALAELYCTSNYREGFETILEASQGIEIEAKARPVKGLDIMAAFGPVDAEFADLEIPPCLVL